MRLLIATLICFTAVQGRYFPAGPCPKCDGSGYVPGRFWGTNKCKMCIESKHIRKRFLGLGEELMNGRILSVAGAKYSCKEATKQLSLLGLEGSALPIGLLAALVTKTGAVAMGRSWKHWVCFLKVKTKGGIRHVMMEYADPATSGLHVKLLHREPKDLLVRGKKKSNELVYFDLPHPKVLRKACEHFIHMRYSLSLKAEERITCQDFVLKLYTYLGIMEVVHQRYAKEFQGTKEKYALRFKKEDRDDYNKVEKYLALIKVLDFIQAQESSAEFSDYRGTWLGLQTLLGAVKPLK